MTTPPPSAPIVLWQRVVVALLIGSFGLAMIVANHTLFLLRTVTDTDAFVHALAPLPADPDVARALGERTGSLVVEGYGLEESIQQILPDALGFIAAPVTQATEDLAADIATGIVASDAFTTIWERTLRGVHRTATAVVEATDQGTLTTVDGYVTLDVTELAAEVRTSLIERGLDIAPQPEGASLQIKLWEADNPGVVERLAELLRSIRWLTFLVTALLAAAAIAMSKDKLRAGMLLGIATVVAMLVSLIDVRVLKGVVTSGVEDPVQLAGVDSAWDIMFNAFVTQTYLVMALGTVAAVVMAVLRSRRYGAGDAPGADRSLDGALEGFAVTYRRPIETVTGVALLAILLLGPAPSPLRALLWMATAAVVVALVEIAVRRQRVKSGRDEPASVTV